MLFTSYEFVLAFLPIVLLVVLGAARFGQPAAAKVFLLAASMVFYAWWNPRYLALLVAMIAFNYVVGSWLIHTRSDDALASRRRTALILGVGANIATLGYFKYTNFLAAQVGDLLGHSFDLAPIVLPLGISFIVFQKIAFLVDAYGSDIKRLSLLDYGLFVSFFPQLISGPIVHHREVVPQLESPTGLRYDPRVVSVAIAFLVIGALKKLVVADSLSPYVATAFDGAAAGSHLGAFSAWAGAVAYTLQVYFDFSGYSDLAIGLGLLFGIRLPFNFNSPLKAVGPIDYWGRWHITLTRFLTAYIYNPLTTFVTRRSMARRERLRVRGVMTGRAFIKLIAVPTLFTMFIAGAWHGAGYQFVVFGLIHGVYLVANHAWRNLRAAPDEDLPPTPSRIALSRAAMFVGAVLAIPFFRADSVRTGVRFLADMFGGHGLAARSTLGDPRLLALLGAWLFVSQVLPNTQQLLRGYLDAVTTPLHKHAGESITSENDWSWPRIVWRPNLAWALVLGVAAWYVLMMMAKTTEFLYFQF